ncbi:5-oxoprolinase subunit PxpA [Aliiglaciecola sp. CAU 1673]|uniref:5-oxoprolinase subunit PxpA n=1 Tax=Aliiglaciecola sp. CAU 1673 TaxID=3032595 RepID=UPI0023DADA8A|nr:5-oxoprolinase subunit PxpA [Aliiglaciecola sp. CAU 1673]MDF2176671.1 5-oxoprolinase subunit PxpA [Aliiglaciecola sp. CAU 1673]
MKLNCDLGESYGNWKMGLDEEVMPHIHQANIACGFHAGDPDVMHRTLQLAAEYQVEVGAHPAYPDLIGFGRRTLHCTSQELINLLHYQIGALDAMAKVQGIAITYVKPHGAMYHDMMNNLETRRTIYEAIRSYPRSLKLMLQADSQAQQYRREAGPFGIELLFEAFADRRYQADGRLLPRNQADAVLDTEQTLAQVTSLVKEGKVITLSGKALKLEADSLCVHGDNPQAVAMVKHIRDLLDA